MLNALKFNFNTDKAGSGSSMIRIDLAFRVRICLEMLLNPDPHRIKTMRARNQCFGSGYLWIRIDFGRLDLDWVCGSGCRREK
jgi:hypothetical protein